MAMSDRVDSPNRSREVVMAAISHLVYTLERLEADYHHFLCWTKETSCCGDYDYEYDFTPLARLDECKRTLMFWTDEGSLQLRMDEILNVYCLVQPGSFAHAIHLLTKFEDLSAEQQELVAKELP